MEVKSLGEFGPKAANPERTEQGTGTNLLGSLATTCPCVPGVACQDKITIPAGAVISCLHFEGQVIHLPKDPGGTGACALPGSTAVEKIKAALWPMVRKYEAEPRKLEVTENEDGSICILHIGQCALTAVILESEEPADGEEPGDPTKLDAERLCKIISCKQHRAYVVPGDAAFTIAIKGKDGEIISSTTIDPSGLTTDDLTEETADLIKAQVDGDLAEGACKPSNVTCVAAGFIVDVFTERPNYPCIPGTGKTPDAPLEYCYNSCEDMFVPSDEECNTPEFVAEEKKRIADAEKAAKKATKALKSLASKNSAKDK